MEYNLLDLICVISREYKEHSKPVVKGLSESALSEKRDFKTF